MPEASGIGDWGRSAENDFSHQSLCGSLKNMGTFYVGAKIENVSDRDKGTSIPKLLVDTGSEYTWVAGATLDKLGIKREKKDLAFVMANGQHFTRSVGFAIVSPNKSPKKELKLLKLFL